MVGARKPYDVRMSDSRGGPGDPYSRVEYRRVIAWDARIAREGPWLLRLLDLGPDRSVVDLGCGTGEHVAFLARNGARAVGLDRSESMIEAARDHERRGEGRFFLTPVEDASALLTGEPRFGLALCLGNVLPHLLDDAELDRFLGAAAGLVAPGGRLLIQIVNYVRIREQGVRTLPVNVRTQDDGTEIVFLRVLTPLDHGRILFVPATLVLDPTAEEPLRVESSRRVELRAWTHEELGPALRRAGFDAAWRGDMRDGPYEASTSHDLVIVATRRPG